MNTISQAGLSVAQQIADAYANNPNVHSVLLGGSTARGIADLYSDLEIGVFWVKPPTNEARREIIMHMGGEVWSLNEYAADSGRAANEHYGLSQVNIEGRTYSGTLMVDAKHMTAEVMERCLSEVLDGYATDSHLHSLMAAIHDAVPVLGVEQIQDWQKKIANYPERLAIKVIQENLWCGPWFHPRVYVMRDDRLVLQQHIVWMQQCIVKVLAALNRRFHPSEEYKWMREFIETLAIVPNHLVQRMNQALCATPHDAVQGMLSIIGEMLDLVDQHLPSVNTISMFAGHPEINTKWARSRWEDIPAYSLLQAITIGQSI